MADDPNAVLREIAAMQGIQMEDGELETSDEQREEPADDEQREEEQREEVEVEARGEGKEREVEAEEEEDSVESRYAKLLDAHNTLSAQLLELQARGYPVGDQSVPAQAPVTPTAPAVVLPPTAAQPSTFQLDDSLLEKALIEDDPAAMKQVITGLLQHVEGLVQAAREQTREAMLRDLPNVATNVARHQLVLMKAVEQFYVENQDLAPFQHIVGAVGNEISMKEPNLSIMETLEKTGAEVRRRLGLRKQAIKTETDRKPAFPRTGSGSRKPGAPTLTGKRAEIAAMQNARQ